MRTIIGTRVAGGFQPDRQWGDPKLRAAVMEALAAKLEATLDQICQGAFGRISLVPRSHGAHPADRQQIRTGVLVWLGGGELRFNFGSGDIGVYEHPNPVVAEMAEAARQIRLMAASARRSIENARESALTAIDRHHCAHSPAKLVSVALVIGPGTAAIQTAIDLEVLGHDLTRRIETFPCKDGDMTSVLDEILSTHLRRANLIVALRSKQSRGVVEATALRIMAAARMDLDYALNNLHRSNGLDFLFDHGRQSGTLQWRDGVLKGGFEQPGSGIRFLNDQLVIDPFLPGDATVTLLGMSLRLDRALLPGRRLREIVSPTHLPHAYIPGGAVIIACRDGGTSISLTLAVPTTLLRA